MEAGPHSDACRFWQMPCKIQEIRIVMPRGTLFRRLLSCCITMPKISASVLARRHLSALSVRPLRSSRRCFTNLWMLATPSTKSIVTHGMSFTLLAITISSRCLAAWTLRTRNNVSICLCCIYMFSIDNTSHSAFFGAICTIQATTSRTHVAVLDPSLLSVNSTATGRFPNPHGISTTCMLGPAWAMRHHRRNRRLRRWHHNQHPRQPSRRRDLLLTIQSRQSHTMEAEENLTCHPMTSHTNRQKRRRKSIASSISCCFLSLLVAWRMSTKSAVPNFSSSVTDGHATMVATAKCTAVSPWKVPRRLSRRLYRQRRRHWMGTP